MSSGTAAPGPVSLPCAVGGRLTPQLLLEAVRAGWIVIPVDGGIWQRAAELRYGPAVDSGAVTVYPAGSTRAFGYTYWSPAERFVIPAGEARINPRLRRRLRDVEWTCTIGRAFAEVVEECGRDREPRWLTDDYVEVLTTLWRDGHVYSSEIWDNGELIAGGFGYVIGDVVTVESNFTRRIGASKVSIVDVANRAGEAGFAMVDLQWPTGHGAQVGGRAAPAGVLTHAVAAEVSRKLVTDERPVRLEPLRAGR